jgi:general secretion pathway protein G
MQQAKHTKRTTRAAFTIVEVMIVVAILAILAAVALPQFVGASDDARLSALETDLMMVRSQLEMYRLHHNGQYPTSAANFVAQMTQYTDVNHNTSATKTATHVYGPYLQDMPANPFTNTNDVTSGSAGATKAWYYDASTGAFRTNDTVHDGL